MVTTLAAALQLSLMATLTAIVMAAMAAVLAAAPVMASTMEFSTMLALGRTLVLAVVLLGAI